MTYCVSFVFIFIFVLICPFVTRLLFLQGYLDLTKHGHEKQTSKLKKGNMHIQTHTKKGDNLHGTSGVAKVPPEHRQTDSRLENKMHQQRDGPHLEQRN